MKMKPLINWLNGHRRLANALLMIACIAGGVWFTVSHFSDEFPTARLAFSFREMVLGLLALFMATRLGNYFSGDTDEAHKKIRDIGIIAIICITLF